MATEVLRQCPSCGSVSVDFSELVGGTARCRVCKWEGSNDGLIVSTFEHLLGSREGIGIELVNSIRRLFSDPNVSFPFGRFLNRWGFIDLTKPRGEVTPVVTRYLAAIARAVLEAVIKERDLIEAETVKKGQKYD